MIPYIYNWETYFSLKNTQADGMSSNFFSAVVAAENLPDLAAPMNVLAPAPMAPMNVLASAPMDVRFPMLFWMLVWSKILSLGWVARLLPRYLSPCQ